MSRVCTVCSHSQREEIDRAIASGEPNRRISSHWNLSEAAVRRHKAGGHINQVIARDRDVAELARGDSLLDQLHTLVDRARAITDQAEAAGDLRTALRGIREVRGCLEVLTKIMLAIEADTRANVLGSPEWTSIRSAILRALEPYPEAKSSVIAELSRVQPIATQDRPGWTRGSALTAPHAKSSPGSRSDYVRLSNLMEKENE